MKYISIFILLLAFICHTPIYSQQNSKGLKLKVSDLKTIENNGKTSWTVKTTLTNHTRDTIFYINAAGCESTYYAATAELDSIHLIMGFKKCNMGETIMALAPSAQKIVNLEFSSLRPITSSFKFKVYLITGRLKNRNDPITFYGAIQKKETIMLVVTKRVKVKVPVGYK